MNIQGSYNIKDTASEVILQTRIKFTRVILMILLLSNTTLLFLTINNRDMANPLSILSTPVLLPLSGILWVFIAFSLIYQNRAINLVINLTAIYLAVLSFATGDNIALLAILSLAFGISALISGRSTYLFTFFILLVRAAFHLVYTLSTYENIAVDANFAQTGAFNAVMTVLFISLTPVIIALFIRYFVNTLQQIVTDTRRTTDLLEASAIIGQIMAKYLDLNELMNQAVNIIRDRFGFYHVQIFMINEDYNYAELTASTGEVGQQLIQNRHRITINSQSIVGRTIQAGEPVVARDTQKSEEHAFNSLLPNTRAELGIPIIDNEKVIGAIDAQSMRVEAFTPVEIQALQVMTSQLATAIRNARLFEQQEANVRENKRLFLDAETNLREIQRLNRQLTGRAWQEYMTSGDRVEGVTLDDHEFKPGATWSAQMNDATQKRRAITLEEDNKHIISVPIELRNEILGAIEIELDTKQVNNEAVDLLLAISNRLAVSLDNARLFEEIQETTAYEQQISDLVVQYQSASSVDELLKITLEGLADALGAEEGAIRIGTPQNGTLADNNSVNQVNDEGTQA